MDPVFLHLRVNHFPIILGIVAIAAAFLAAATRKDAVWQYAAVTMIAAAVSAPVAYWTGLRAEDVADGLELLADPGMMVDHKDSALWALLTLIPAGVAAGVAFRLRSPRTRAAFVALATLALCATLQTAAHAGKIAHERTGPSKEKWVLGIFESVGLGGDVANWFASSDHWAIVGLGICGLVMAAWTLRQGRAAAQDAAGTATGP